MGHKVDSYHALLLSTDVLREMVLTYQSECVHTIVPVLTQVHLAFQESNIPGMCWKLGIAMQIIPFDAQLDWNVLI